MPRKGIAAERIIEEAILLVQENGYKNLSMRDLASRLHIQAPSLYNHFSGIDEIKICIAKQIEVQMTGYMEKSITGKEKDDAIHALGLAQLAYAQENPELYNVILALPELHDPQTDRAAEATVSPIESVLDKYHLSQEMQLHLQRMFRSLVHGYISLHRAGYLSHREITMEESFLASLTLFTEIVHSKEIK